MAIVSNEEIFVSIIFNEGLLNMNYDSDKLCYDNESTLIKFIEDLRKEPDLYYSCKEIERFNSTVETKFDYTCRHSFIWETLVLMFGDYGTSLNYGWIIYRNECADFLDYILKESLN